MYVCVCVWLAGGRDSSLFSAQKTKMKDAHSSRPHTEKPLGWYRPVQESIAIAIHTCPIVVSGTLWLYLLCVFSVFVGSFSCSICVCMCVICRDPTTVAGEPMYRIVRVVKEECRVSAVLPCYLCSKERPSSSIRLRGGSVSYSSDSNSSISRSSSGGGSSIGSSSGDSSSTRRDSSIVMAVVADEDATSFCGSVVYICIYVYVCMYGRCSARRPARPP